MPKKKFTQQPIEKELNALIKAMIAKVENQGEAAWTTIASETGKKDSVAEREDTFWASLTPQQTEDFREWLTLMEYTGQHPQDRGMRNRLQTQRDILLEELSPEQKRRFEELELSMRTLAAADKIFEDEEKLREKITRELGRPPSLTNIPKPDKSDKALPIHELDVPYHGDIFRAEALCQLLNGILCRLGATNDLSIPMQVSNKDMDSSAFYPKAAEDGSIHICLSTTVRHAKNGSYIDLQAVGREVNPILAELRQGFTKINEELLSGISTDAWKITLPAQSPLVDCVTAVTNYHIHACHSVDEAEMTEGRIDPVTKEAVLRNDPGKYARLRENELRTGQASEAFFILRGRAIAIIAKDLDVPQMRSHGREA